MKQIKGFEGLYSINENGMVYSHPREKTLKNWKNKGIDIVGKTKGKYLTPILNGGYLRVSLSKNGKCFIYMIHRLIALTFIPRIKGKNHINHINSIKTDNRIDNLEWCTPKENVRKSIESGKFHFSKFKFSIKIRKEIIRLHKQGKTIRELAKIYNCSYGCIQKLTGKEVKIGNIIYKKKIKECERDNVLKYRNDGLTLKEISLKYNCSLQVVHYFLKKQ